MISNQPCRIGKRHFTKEEDSIIVSLVQVYGLKSWNKISQSLMNRTSRQCRERWKNYLSPTVNNGAWTVDEDMKLGQLTDKFGSQWAKISQFFENRTDINVKNRWMLLQRAVKKNNRDQMPIDSSASGGSSPEENIKCSTEVKMQQAPIFDSAIKIFEDYQNSNSFEESNWISWDI